MDTSKMTRRQLMEQIDKNVSAWLGFGTGLAGLTNKSKAALEFLCQRTNIMAENARKFEALKAELGEPLIWHGSSSIDPELHEKYNKAWEYYRVADDIWGNLWEGFDGSH